MSWSIGGVNLPVAPQTVMCKLSGDVQAYRYPGTLPYIAVFGQKAKVLVLEGYIYSKGYTKDQLEDTWIIPYEGKVATQVELACPDDRYDNTDWIFVKFDYKEEKAGVSYFTYRMEFWLGSSAEVI